MDKRNSSTKKQCHSVSEHEKIIRSTIEGMPQEEILLDLADLFKIFGDSTRIKILFALYESEMCVFSLTQSLNMTQSAISHQLKILRQSKLVKTRREGKSIIYSLADEHVVSILAQGIDHILE